MRYEHLTSDQRLQSNIYEIHFEYLNDLTLTTFMLACTDFEVRNTNNV